MRQRNKELTPLGKLVVKALVDRNQSRAQLAAEIGVAPQYLSYILKHPPPDGSRS